MYAFRGEALCLLLAIVWITVVLSKRQTSFADDWWLAMSPKDDPTDDSLFKSLGSSKLYLRSMDLDENHLHSCFEYKLVNTDSVISHSNTFCLPLIVVAGIRKCSTSALYNLLAQYPKALRIPNKENCVQHYSNIIEYFISLPTHVDKGEIFMDGCIEPPSTDYLRKLLGKIHQFYLITTRDYADWIWSAYNYWCNENYDGSCPRKTVDVNTCKRSPELLHEIVLGGLNGQKVQTPLQAAGRVCPSAEKRYRGIFDEYWRIFPVQNSLIVASEDLEENPGRVWMRIALSIGLNTSHPHIKEFETVRYNVQAESKNTTGFGKTVNASTFQPGLYEVSGYKPMMQETQDIIRRCWVNDCVYTSLLTRHMYAACKVEATKQNARVVTYLSSAVTDNNSKANSLSYIKNILALEEGKTDQFTPYLDRIRDDVCARTFKGVTESLAASGAAGGGGSGKKSSTPASKSKGKAAATSGVSNVFLLTTSAEDAEYLEELLYFSTLGAAKVYNSLPHTSVNATSRLREVGGERLNSGGGGLCDAGGQPVLMIAHPGSIYKTDHALPVDREIGHKEALSYSFALNTSSLQGGASSPNKEALQCLSGLLFNKVVVLTTDLMTNLWAAYLKKYEFDSGLTESMLYRFNWNKWDDEAVAVLKNITSVTTLSQQQAEQEGVYWSAAHLAPLVGGIGCNPMSSSTGSEKSSSGSTTAMTVTAPIVSENKLSFITPLLDITVTPDYHQKAELNEDLDSTLVMISREDLMYSESRVSVLKQLLDFVSPTLRNTSEALFTANVVRNSSESLDPLRCAYKETVLDSVEDRYNHLRLSKYLHLAYASEELVCGLRHFVKTQISEHSGGRLSPQSPEFSLLDKFVASCQAEVPVRTKTVIDVTATSTTTAVTNKLSPTVTANCHSRYLDSSIRPTPTLTSYVLLGNPGPHITNVRLLLEHGTGVMTGSVMANKNLSSTLEGESLCSLTQSVIFMPAANAVVTRMMNLRRLTDAKKADPKVVVPKVAIVPKKAPNSNVVVAAAAPPPDAGNANPTRKRKPKAAATAASPTVTAAAAVVESHSTSSSVYNVTTRATKDMRRCNANGIRGFGRGIIVIEDPFVAVYKEYLKKTKKPTTEGEIKSTMLSILKSSDLATLINFPLELLDQLQKANSISNLDYRVLSAELLLLPYAYGVLAKDNKQVILKQLAMFLNVPKPFQERLDCMYSFIPNYTAQVQAVEEVGEFFSAHPEVVCALNNELQKKFTFDDSVLKFRFYRLFADVKCA